MTAPINHSANPMTGDSIPKFDIEQVFKDMPVGKDIKKAVIAGLIHILAQLVFGVAAIGLGIASFYNPVFIIPAVSCVTICAISCIAMRIIFNRLMPENPQTDEDTNPVTPLEPQTI
jgi:hypothetical protein